MNRPTPGPWYPILSDVTTDKRELFYIRTTPHVLKGEPAVAKIVLGHRAQSTNEANARLIAASPDLLAAVDFLHRMFADGELSSIAPGTLSGIRLARGVQLLTYALARVGYKKP